MRLPPLADLLVIRLRNTIVCLIVTPLQRNRHMIFSSLLVATLLYISLVITHHQMNGFQQQQQQQQVSPFHFCSNSNDTSRTGSNSTAGAAHHASVPSSVSAPETEIDPLLSNKAHQKSSNNSSSSSEVLLRVGRPFFNYLVGNLRDRAFPGARNYSDYHLIQHPRRFRILPGVRPLRADFGPVVNDVTSFGYPIDLAPCRNDPSNNNNNSSKAKNSKASHKNKSHIGLFLAVISAPGYFDKRQVIRKTWLSQLMASNRLNNNNNNASAAAGDASSTPVVKLVGHGFVVGLTEDKDIQKRIEQESATHGDILQVNVIDTYADLTRKVTAAWNWINSRCSRVDFVLKVDDDVYVNTRNLISVVKTLNSSHQSIIGKSADGIVRRDGKFAVSVDDWPWSNYPPYSMGAFLLMPGSVIQSLLAAAQTTPYFPFEDTYIGLCADKARVKMRFSPRALAGFVTNKPQPCYVHNSISWLTQSVSVAHQSHNATEEFYHNVTHCKKLIEMPIDPFKTPRKFDFT